jgi:hypothetical protein
VVTVLCLGTVLLLGISAVLEYVMTVFNEAAVTLPK